MSGITEISGLNISNAGVTAANAVGWRTLSALFGDAPTIESYGAVGDGVTDDTQAFVAALNGGGVARLGPKTYVVNGAVVISGVAAIIGIAGQSRISRQALQGGGNWFTHNGESLLLDGVTFDAGNLAGGDFPAFLISGSCQYSRLNDTAFVGAPGPSSGHGLAVQSGVASNHIIRYCDFNNNTLDGFNLTGSGWCRIERCNASLNGQSGYAIANSSQAIFSACVSSSNNIGIQFGTLNGQVNYDLLTGGFTADGCYLSQNFSWGIRAYGVYVNITRCTLLGNGQIGPGGAIQAQIAKSCILDSFVQGGSSGIDARASTCLKISGNEISGSTAGILVGGCVSTQVVENRISRTERGILITAIEPSFWFTPTSMISVDRNLVELSTLSSVAVSVTDGAAGVSITGNTIYGTGPATVGQALWLHSDQIIVQQNRWGELPRPLVTLQTVAGRLSLVVPDTADSIAVVGSGGTIASVLTQHQADTLGQIAFLRVTNAGAGYTSASVDISGSGTGAAASAIVNGGQVVWIVVTNPGSGYGAIGATASITITGDGAGASAIGFVGLPPIEGRRLNIATSTPITFQLSGAEPTLASWSAYDTTIPAYGSADFDVIAGQLCLTASPPVDYVDPTGDGGVMLKSENSGVVALYPVGGGFVQISSDSEPIGVSVRIGRGSPEGVVMAPPGSDYRNLNGGAGQTMWVKQSGSDANGWLAIA